MENAWQNPAYCIFLHFVINQQIFQLSYQPLQMHCAHWKQSYPSGRTLPALQNWYHFVSSRTVTWSSTSPSPHIYILHSRPFFFNTRWGRDCTGHQSCFAQLFITTSLLPNAERWTWLSAVVFTTLKTISWISFMIIVCIFTRWLWACRPVLSYETMTGSSLSQNRKTPGQILHVPSYIFLGCFSIVGILLT